MQLGQIAQQNNMKLNAQFYGIPFPTEVVFANAILFNTSQLPINTTAIPITLWTAH
jgi:hypothetical protein